MFVVSVPPAPPHWNAIHVCSCAAIITLGTRKEDNKNRKLGQSRKFITFSGNFTADPESSQMLHVLSTSRSHPECIGVEFKTLVAVDSGGSWKSIGSASKCLTLLLLPIHSLISLHQHPFICGPKCPIIVLQLIIVIGQCW